MSRSAERFVGDLQTMRKLVEALSQARSVEECYAFGLNAIDEIFRPNRFFVSLTEINQRTAEMPLRSGWLSSVSVAIHAGTRSAGTFMLQFDRARSFAEIDIEVAQLIAAQCGMAIQALHKHTDKEEFVAMAVHELRSRLSAMLGGATILKSGKTEPAARAIEMIERNGRGQAKLIEELLNLSQIDAGKVELQKHALDVGSVLDRVIEDFRHVAASSNTSILMDVDRPLNVMADEQRLWQIFSNLLSNALRFAPDGEVRIAAAGDSDSAKISISDNGCGISPDQLPHIFDRFRQAHAPKLQAYDGAGLGLAIVKDLVAMHGGSILVESDGDGKGSTFMVYLPLA